MKTRRLTAAASAAALGLAASIVLVAPASAADYYVADGDLGVEDADSNRGYPDNTWFTGQSTTGTQTFTDDGLVLTGRTMLLYGAAEIPLTGDLFIELVQGAAVDADGDWSFQFPIYLDNDEPQFFTTLRPADNTTIPTALDSQWISSTGNGTGTLQEIAEELDFAIDELGWSPALLAFGVLVDSDWDPLTLRSITFDGDTHFFTPLADEGPVGGGEEDDDVATGDETVGTGVEDAAPATPVAADATFTG